MKVIWRKMLHNHYNETELGQRIWVCLCVWEKWLSSDASLQYEMRLLPLFVYTYRPRLLHSTPSAPRSWHTWNFNKWF